MLKAYIILLHTLFIYFPPLLYQHTTIHDTSKLYTNSSKNGKFKFISTTKNTFGSTKKSYLNAKQKNDTVNMIIALTKLSNNNKNIGKYNLSFDYLWEALFLSKESTNLSQESKIRRSLARLYEYYNLNDAALFQLKQALSISKSTPDTVEDYASNLIGSYMFLTVHQRTLGNYHMAMSYLDSCILVQNQFKDEEIHLPFLDAERGNLFIKLRRFNEANTYLLRAKHGVENEKIPYKANIYLYLGELHRATNNIDSAIYYYKKSLKLIQNKEGDYLLLPSILLSLSEIYSNQNKKEIAYKYLYQSKVVSDSLTQLQNSSNSKLFEIKDSYLKSLKKKDMFISEQKKELTYQKQIQSRLQIILILALLLGATAALIVRMRLKLKKTILEKKNSELESKLNEKRIKAEVEIKSKELTSYALQVIDKDTAIDELLEALKNEATSSYKSLYSKYKKGSKDLWDEFNLRFKEVNSAFYDRLNAKHPDLSSTELKHCALIKLNFGTKEMARILNIAPHSVHVSRSRIRKKMALKRALKLEKYIANL